MAHGTKILQKNWRKKVNIYAEASMKGAKKNLLKSGIDFRNFIPLMLIPYFRLFLVALLHYSHSWLHIVYLSLSESL